MRDNEIQWKKINSKSCEKTKRGNEPRLGQKRFFKVSAALSFIFVMFHISLTNMANRLIFVLSITPPPDSHPNGFYTPSVCFRITKKQMMCSEVESNRGDRMEGADESTDL